LVDLKDNQSNKNGSRFPSLKKIIIRIYIATAWLFIALILLTATRIASYEDIRYFFWTMSVLIPLLYMLYVKGVPLSKEEGEKERRAILVLIFSFICLVLTFFAVILV
jgi:hypothetical protein